MPDKKQKRFEKDYALPAYNAEILTREKSFADYFEKVIKNKTKDLDAKSIANWIINKKINYVEIDPEELLRQIAIDKQVSSIDETQLVTFIDEVISENEKAVTDYKNGKEASLMFLLGKTMKKIGKKVDTKLILETIKKKTS